MFLSKFLSKKSKNLSKTFSKSFGQRNGPYNPNKYKSYFIPKNQLTKEQIFENQVSFHSTPMPPRRNVRHVNPVRESGPLPLYDGTHTMEDLRKIIWNTTVGRDKCHCSVDVDELMRRVPGITRKEAEHITKLGLSPDEEVDYAYIAYNIGLDVFYLPNQSFVGRQVVTNSKGEKVEVLLSAQAFEDLALLNVGFAPVLENVDYHWEIFLWSDPPIKAINDIDLSVPNTWFEYEQELWQEMNILEDQFSLPEDERPYPTPRNPFARKELWKSQEQLQEELEMLDENWYPKGTELNIYQQKDFKSLPKDK